MPIDWSEEARWADDAVEKAKELGCSIEEAKAVVDVLMHFTGAPARVTRLATHYLEHMTELSEEIERDKKISEMN